MAKRNDSIEVFRVLLMFGICFLHAVSHGDFYCHTLVKILCPAVCGFVFISGWFGVRFSVGKILRLYAMGAYAALAASLVPQLQAGGFAPLEYLTTALKLWREYWFLHGYVVLMCFAPAVNYVVEKAERKEAIAILAPIMAFSFVWSWGASAPFVGRFFPETEGLGAYTGFSLLAVYALARICRRHFPELPLKVVGIVFCISFVGVLLTGGMYHSPFAALLAASTFYFFLPMGSVPTPIVRMVDFLSPSLFSIYLLHSHVTIGFPLMKALENRLAEHMPVACAYFATAAIVFWGCLVLDLPRRILFWLVARTVSRRAAPKHFSA